MECQKPDSQGQSPRQISGVHRAPRTYSKILNSYIRLLRREHFSPYEYRLKHYLSPTMSPMSSKRMWQSSRIRAFLKIPNAARQELFYADNILRSLEFLDNNELRALARYSAINLQRLKRRVYINQFTQITGGLVILAPAYKIGGSFLDAMPSTAKESLKQAVEVVPVEIRSLLLEMSLLYLVAVAIGFMLSALVAWVIMSPRIALVESLDEIISVAVTARGL